MLCRAACEGALRKLGKLGAGRAARTADLNDTFDALTGLYQSWIASGALGRLRDVIPMADYTACENERIFRTVADTIQITLPETVASCWGDPCDYGSRWVPPVAANPQNYDQRPPRDGAVVVVVDSFTATTVSYIYDGVSKRWQAIDGLGLDDEAPLSLRDPQGFMSAVAMEVVDQFGNDPPARTQQQAARFIATLTNSFSMPRREMVGEFV